MQAKTAVLGVTTLGFVLAGLVYKTTQPEAQLVVEHVPDTFARRAGDLTANVCGVYTGHAPLQYLLNAGEWRELDPRRSANPRFFDHRFSLELMPEDLRRGTNSLRLLGDGVDRFLTFRYDDAPVAVPVNVDWRSTPLDVQDGAWERVDVDGETWVRPVPGTEGYDRVLNVTGAFADGRRIEVDMTFRGETHPGRLFGFGVIPLWGGHRDVEEQLPRRGWRYGIGWYYSKQDGIGVEFADKLGAEPFDSTTASELAKIEVGETYRTVVEAVPDFGGWILRMKWWKHGDDEPTHWIELADHGKRLPPGDYSVALVAHRCQVEFGPVRVNGAGTP